MERHYHDWRLNTITTDMISQQDSNKLYSSSDPDIIEPILAQTSGATVKEKLNNVDSASVIDNADHVDASCVNTLETAIHYHNAYSFNVIPIPKPEKKSEQHLENDESNFTASKADGKSAAGYESWKELRVQRQEREDVVRRFGNKGDCNIAALTGTSLGVLAFDIDGDEALEYFDKAVEKLADTDISTAIKNTMVTKTGSGHGRHIIFRVDPTEFQSNDKKIKTITLWVGTGNHSEIN
jgi:hypothetical protein